MAKEKKEMSNMLNDQLKAFMRWDGERHPNTATVLPMPNGNFSSWTKQQRWEAWQASTTQKGFVLVPIDQAEDTARLEYLLSGSFMVIEESLVNEDFEEIAKGFVVNEVYFISGWDRVEEAVFETKRQAIDRAIVIKEQQR